VHLSRKKKQFCLDRHVTYTQIISHDLTTHMLEIIHVQ